MKLKVTLFSIFIFLCMPLHAFDINKKIDQLKKIKKTNLQIKEVIKYKKLFATEKKKTKANKSLTKKQKLVQFMNLNTHNSVFEIIYRGIKKNSISNCQITYDEIIYEYRAGTGFKGTYPEAVDNGLKVLSILCKDPKLAKTPKVRP